jgi:hypothetical protein
VPQLYCFTLSDGSFQKVVPGRGEKIDSDNRSVLGHSNFEGDRGLTSNFFHGEVSMFSGMTQCQIILLVTETSSTSLEYN